MLRKVQATLKSAAILVCFIAAALAIVVPILILLMLAPEATLGLADLLAAIADGLGLLSGPGANDRGSGPEPSG